VVASTASDREAVDEAVARGSDLLKQGKLDEAQQAFRSALLMDGENLRILALLGLTHFRAGQFTEARPIYEELVERAPSDASHRLNLGLVYLKLGESDKAIGSLEASRALDPSQGRAVSYLGLAYARAGRYTEAYKAFLLAGQNDLASEIEINLTPSERETIQTHLRAGLEPRTAPPRPPPHTNESSTGIPLMSMPAIVIDRPPPSESPPLATEPPNPPPPQPGSQGSTEIIIDHDLGDPPSHPADSVEHEAERAFDQLRAHDDAAATSSAPVFEITAPPATDSVRFVMPTRDAVPEPAPGQSMVSRALEVATPAAAAAGAARIGAGSSAPIPLSQLATDQLVRVEDGSEPFEVTESGALVIRVTDRTLSRLEGVHVTGGELEFEPATRRSRGSQTDDSFDFGGARMHVVSGDGYLIAVTTGDHTFTAVALDDDILYLREDLVFAFEASLRWENGNVPGLRDRLPVVQFRGDGAVALRTAGALVRVKLPAQGVIYVDAMRLAGWIGRVIPRTVVPPKDGPMGEVCVECTGEGVVLIDPSGTLPSVRTRAGAEPAKAAPPPPPPPSADAAERGASDGEPGSGSSAIDVERTNWLEDDDHDGDGGSTSGDDTRGDA
jgi:hypothetical protein